MRSARLETHGGRDTVQIFTVGTKFVQSRATDARNVLAEAGAFLAATFAEGTQATMPHVSPSEMVPHNQCESSQTGPTVLIVEDQEDVREPNAVALEAAGYRVIEADSWSSALALVDEQHTEVDLILTDLLMPGDAGVNTFFRLRKEHGTIPVVVYSAYPNVMRLLRGVLDGVVEWLQKPLEVAIVVQAVDRALHRVRS